MLMRLLRNRTFRIVAVLVLIGTPIAWLTARNASAADDSVVARVKKGDFKIVVTTSGELRAPKFVNITGPQNMQQAEIWNGVKIQSIVAEGTQVKEGDVVAELDRSPVATKLADVSLALQKAQAQTEQASLDSVLTLSKAREDMHTAILTLEEKKLAKDQSKFEAPSVQRQAAIDYEKAFRTLKQDSMDYGTKTEQAKAKMREVGSDLERQKNKLKIIQDVMSGFTIKAPAPGMVIYIKDWQGKKRAVGGQVSPWEPSVATLPDLSVMESVTFVNEIDVRKLAIGQSVALSLDADPGKRLKARSRPSRASANNAPTPTPKCSKSKSSLRSRTRRCARE
jgi:multidrug efflux pump subunit AcrA (membrane-fusion protein)